ncbi:MAG: hypothetical protein C4562_03640 [Actinobacteria bacterium]|nr:MAG: hypothetical protein C4562_03640 [Actinomycetota bacterium]
MELKDKKSIIYTLLIAVPTILAVVVILFMMKPRLRAETKVQLKPVTLSDCTPCHANIDSFSHKNLIFDHWVHFNRGIACHTCHTTFGHKNGKTIIPSPKTCYGCHSLASGKLSGVPKVSCNLCHPPNISGKAPSNHNYSGVIAKVEPSVSPIKKLKGPVKLSDCTDCHGDIDANVPAGLKFNHWAHFQKGVACSTCHKEPIHQSGKVNRPTMNFCFSCHGLGHSKQGLVAGEQCSLCHTAGFELRPPTHFAPNWKNAHKSKVNESLFECLTCHQKSFCQNCHMASKVKLKGQLPPNKQKTKHDTGHYQPKNADCTICHNDAFCVKCHKTSMPHPYTWLGTHKKLGKKMDKNDCYICHKKLTFCNSCHHGSVNKLTAKNCKKCHKNVNDSLEQVMAKANALTDERNALPLGSPRRLVLVTTMGNLRAQIWHKVHFSKKYSCDRCHKENLSGLKSETFELCKFRGCHPAGQKKPPSGDALCWKCHPKRHEPITAPKAKP